jgi:DNA primase
LEIPDGKIFALILKAVRTKAFFKISIDEKYPYFFGFGPEFLDFKKGDIIALSEGVKDALAIKTVYKYSLAYLTSKPEKGFWDMLRILTTRVIVFADNDGAGRKIIKDEDFGFCGKFFVGRKDAGEYWEEKDLKKRVIQERIRQAIKQYQNL